MTGTKKTMRMAAVLLGMLMLTASSVMARPPRRGGRRPHRPHWSHIVGGILGGFSRPAPRRHYVPGHYVVQYTQVLVMPGHYEMKTQPVLVEPGHFEARTVPAVTHTITKADGSTEVVVVQPARTTQVWVPDRYEMKTTKVWVPARYETRAFRRYVPGHYVY